MDFIELRDIYKTYHLGEIDVPVLKGISLKVSHGEFVALMGTSGSGKTTLMNILGCLDRPSSGEFWLDGQDVVALSADEWAQLRNQKIGFVFQTFNLLPRTSALENVIMPLSYTAQHLSDQEGRQRAEDLLRRVGLGDRLDHEPSQLSGGQQQRVAIARALINNPAILFADEPTGNLDSKTSEEVLELFRRLNEEEGVTIILVTHDANVARSAKRIIRITDGMVEAEEPQTQAAPGGQVGASPPAGAEVAAKLRSGLAWLRLQWMVRTALHGLSRNVMRAALTTLGIVIGVAAVIAMMEIGSGSSSAIQATIASMGANNLLVLPGTASSGGVSFGGGSVMTLTPQDAEAILNECPGGQRRSAGSPGPDPGHLWQPQLGALLYLWHHSRLARRPGMGPGRGRHVHGAGCPQRQQGLRAWARGWSGSCSRAKTPSAKKFASRMSPSG